MAKLMIGALVLLFSFSSFAAMTHTSQILPDNNLWIGVEQKNASMTEAKFNALLDKIEAMYKPIVKAKGGILKINRGWTDGTVNSNTGRQGKTWVINTFGGIARHSAVTPDGFALVICHELGHQIGGAPKYQESGSEWASNEGQSDYYGVLKCMKRLVDRDDNVTIMAKVKVPALLAKTCAANFSDANDAAVCKRVGMAGMSLAKLFQVLEGLAKVPSFSTPDSSVVDEMSDSHPASQCRLDTYYAAAICDRDFSEDVSNSDMNKGVCDSDHYKVGDGARPLCWFKPE